jgi:hypothetical protein
MKANNTGTPKQPPIRLSKPWIPRRVGFRVTVGFGLITTLALGIFGYLCRYSDSIALLPAVHGAEWIIYPKPMEATRESAYPLSATFRHSFVLQPTVSKPLIKLYAYKTASLLVNERVVALPRTIDAGWKRPTVVDASEFLRPGTNDLSVIVSNAVGPPALWLRLESGEQTLTTDRAWEVSLAGSMVERACLARELIDRRPDKSLQGSDRTLNSIARLWPWLTLLFIVSLAIAFLTERTLRVGHGSKFLTPGRAINCLLTLILLARFSICFHNIPLLPGSMGFDAEAHEDYVKFVSEKHALPLAKDGWEMFQPPLYYAIGAMVIGIDGGYVKNEHTTALLRAINGVIGLLQCWLVLLCLKRLLPQDFEAQAVGLAVAAFLPPNLNLAHYVTNEPLAALFATGAFYFLLRTLANEKLNDYIALGAFLGLAMLAKFSSLLIVAGAAGALGLRVFQKSLMQSPPPIRWGEGSRVRGSLHWQAVLRAVPNFWRGPLAALICLLLVCGWHYIRVWINSGHPFIGNWESSSPFAWRQDPGFRVSEFYFKFGKAMVSPLFSSFHSFADGIYSTLWGDGLASGAARLTSRPPWNYDWMNAAYLLGIGLSAFTIVGIVVAFVCFFRARSAQWVFILWSLGSFAAAIVFMSLRVPTYAQVKAFYGMPALVSFAAVFALGWKELIRRWPVLRYLMRTILLAWLACVAIAFWIHENNPDTSLVRGLYLVEGIQDSQAIENLSIAFEKDAAAEQSGKNALSTQSKVEGHFNLGLVLDRRGQALQAIDHYRQALQIDPDFDGALNNLAWLLATCSNPSLRNGTDAVALARRACDLTQERTTVYIGTLAAAYAEAGKFPQAISTAEKAIRCAKLRGQEELARRNGELLEIYHAGKPYRESAGR